MTLDALKVESLNMADETTTSDTNNEPMDPRLVAYLKDHCGPNHYGEQDENGVDLSILRESLRLTPYERLKRGESGRLSAIALREYGRLVDHK